MNRSSMKTWLKRNGFRPSARGLARLKFWKYFKGRGRLFRLRFKSYEWPAQVWRPHPPIVDVGEKYETFDRWANSCERTISWDEFMTEFGKGIGRG